MSDRQFQFMCRPDSIGDAGVVQQVFRDRCYALDGFAHAQPLRRWLDAQDAAIPLILDAGANIGASAVFFSEEFPEARIIAIEPEENNFKLLEENTRMRRVTCVRGAVACDVGLLYLSDPGRGDWGFRTGLVMTDTEVEAFSVPSLLKLHPEATPFIFKCDIEGGESLLFQRATGWLNLFPVAVIELHDWMLPGRGTSRTFLNALAAYDFEVVLRGENLWCWNNRLLQAYHG